MYCEHLQNKNGYALKKKRSWWYLKDIMADANDANELVLPAIIQGQAESIFQRIEQPAGIIGLYLNANKTEYMCFKQKKPISF